MEANRHYALAATFALAACRDPAPSPPPAPRPLPRIAPPAREVAACARIVGHPPWVARRPWTSAQVFMQIADSTGGEGQVDANEVHRLIRGQLLRIRACYEAALTTQVPFEGLLDVTFTIGPTGTLTRAAAAGLPGAPSVGVCVTDLFRTLAFPAPEGGSVDFDFPFLFCPPDGGPDVRPRAAPSPSVR